MQKIPGKKAEIRRIATHDGAPPIDAILILTCVRDLVILPPHDRAQHPKLLSRHRTRKRKNLLNAAQRVLVVDGLAETEEVLRAVLEPRGLEVERVRAAGAGAFAAKHRPSVIVLHVDDGRAPAHDGWRDVPRVLIGATDEFASHSGVRGEGEQYLEKPFQYGELIRAIERLLAARNL